MSIKIIYDHLYDAYGPQGWWPLIKHKGSNPTKTGSVQGYHPNDYSFPKTEDQKFEICIGAILTQNTGWTQVELALHNLDSINALNATRIKELDLEKLKQAIRPAGYYNQKARKIKEFTAYYLELKDIPTRDELLRVWGIGPETADAILLYACKVPTFVIDAYTKRITAHLGMNPNASYNQIKELFETALEKDYKLFQEFHALLVEHAKRHYSKKPYGETDDLLKDLKL